MSVAPSVAERRPGEGVGVTIANGDGDGDGKGDGDGGGGGGSGAGSMRTGSPAEAPAAAAGAPDASVGGAGADGDAQAAARGRALLREWPRQLSVRRQMVVNAVVVFALLLHFPIGVTMLHMFDENHEHFSYPFLFGGALYYPMGLLWVAYPVPPAFWERIPAFRAAAPAAAQLGASMRGEAAVASVINLATIVLFVIFGLSDLGPRGGANATPTLQWAVVAAYFAAEFVPFLHIVNVLVGGKVSLPMAMPAESALQLLLSVVTAFVDGVEAGMPVAAIEEGLLELRELMVMLHGCVLSTFVTIVAFAAWLIGAAAVCVLEPDPPAYFVVLAVTMFIWLFFTPLTAARIDAQLRRIPVALSVRACRAGGASGRLVGKGQAGGSAAAPIDSAHAAGHWRVGVESGNVRRRAKPQAAEGGEREADSEGVQEEAAAAVLDLLQLRIEKMRLGWFILGTPVTSALIARLRALVTAVLLVGVRSAVGL